MSKYGIINKVTNKMVKTYTHTRMKSIKISNDEIQFELLEANGDHGLDERAYSWDGTQIVFDSNYVPFDPTQKHLKIYRYIQNSNDYRLFDVPKGHDYKRGLTDTLFPKEYFNHGEMYKSEYFSDEAQTDLVIRVDILYTRDAMGFATNRTTTRTWILEDGTEHPDTKVTTKVYRMGTLGPIEEGIRRRGNIVKGLQMPILGMMIGTISAKDGESEPERQTRCVMLGRRFLEQHKNSFTMFTEDSNRQIVEDVSEATDFWIDAIVDAQGGTIREYIIEALNIGGLA